MTGKTFIFDLDDTLRWTSWDYSWANAAFYKLLYEELRHNVPYITHLAHWHQEIDHKLAKLKGLTPERFLDSLEDTYKACCEKFGVRPTKAAAHRMRMCGKQIFDADRYAAEGLVDGAEEMLDFLNAKGDALYLVTRGVQKEQTKKIKATGLDEVFPDDRIFIVDDVPPLKQPYFRRILEGKDAASCYSVGDGMDSDVNEATELGMWGLHIPNHAGTWIYDQEISGVDKRVQITRTYLPALERISTSLACSCLSSDERSSLEKYVEEFKKLDSAKEITPGPEAYARRAKGVAWFPERTKTLQSVKDIVAQYDSL